jgi:hypothetical protein
MLGLLPSAGHPHELHRSIAFASWLGVHAWLMSGVRSRADAFISWGWDYFSTNRTPAIVDRSDAGRIDWGDETDETDETDLPVTDDGHRVPADQVAPQQPDAIRAR